jgi:hypothetical protein
MTLQLTCTIKDDRVIPLDSEKVRKWKDAHADGEVFDMVLADSTSTALSPLAKRYFATRDEYAAVTGYTNECAHIELKWLHGVWCPPDEMPIGRSGRKVEYHGEEIWQLSIRDYSSDELRRLVDGATLRVAEAGV